MLDSHACIITTSTPAVQSAGGSETDTHTWRSYLAEQRMVRNISVDAQGKPLPYDSPRNTSVYVKLDMAGRTLVLAREVGAGELERLDFQRDGHGNAVSYREVHTARRDLLTPAPEQPSVAYGFINHYSSDGLLEKHNRTDSGGSINYRHDADGRCQLILADDGIEQRDYDEAGRLSIQSFSSVNPDTPTASTQSSVTTHRYDEQGRLHAIERDGDGPAALPVDGQPDVQMFWSYVGDGSWSVETLDFTSQSPNDTVERDGASVAARRTIETWSAGCAALEATIPVPLGNACATD